MEHVATPGLTRLTRLARRLGSGLWRVVLPALLLWMLLEIVMRVGLGLGWLPTRPPDFWLAGAAKLWRWVTWRQLNGGMGLTLAFLPVALTLSVLAPRRGLAFASLATALLLAMHPLVHIYLPQWSSLPAVGRFSIAADLVMQALTLPLLTWLAGRALFRAGLGGTGTTRTPAGTRVRPEGLAWVGLSILVAGLAAPLFLVWSMGTAEAPLRMTLATLIDANPVAVLVLGAPLLAGMALVAGPRGRWRRPVLTAVPVLLIYGLVALALEAVKPLILERIHSPLPASPLWNPEVVSVGAWILLCAQPFLWAAWILALRRPAAPVSP
ncbi:MAG: hypothetical protein WC326_11930 [Candidatus Delongbacteria bacterium]